MAKTESKNEEKTEAKKYFPFDTDAVPFPHQNAPAEQHLIEEPADGQYAFEFTDGVLPTDFGVQIENPDLTDDTLFDNVPKTYSEHVAALRAEGAIDGDVDGEKGAVLDEPDPATFAIVNETTNEPKSTSAESIQEAELKTAEEPKTEEKTEEPVVEAPKRRTRAEVAADAEK